MSENMATKVLTHDALLAARSDAHKAGRRVVQCHGCFDIVHPGHVRHLQQARALGDVLLVSITGDGAIDKGTGRPLIPEELRAENLAALDCVDWVYVEPRPTAAELLDEVRPDIYVKGREYEFNRDPRFAHERATVERHGGRVVFSSGDVVFSSTALMASMERSVDPLHHRLTQLMQLDELQGPALYQLISAFRGKRVLVVGEAMRDTYVLCDRPSVAGESPVMTLRPIERRRFDGGSLILARHLLALGARPVVVTALPETDEGRRVRERLTAQGIELRTIPIESALPETQRYLVGTQKVMEVDQREPIVLDAAGQDRLVKLAADAARNGKACDAAIIADHGLGLLTPAVLASLTGEIRRRVDVLAGISRGRRSTPRALHGADLTCLSEAQLREWRLAYDEGLPAATWKLLRDTRAGAAIVTLDGEGLVAFERLPDEPGETWPNRVHGEHVPSLCPYAVDAVGGSDALLAAATLTMSVGGSLLAGAFLGAVASAEQAQRIGNVPVTTSDLRGAIARIRTAHLAYVEPEVIQARTVGRCPSVPPAIVP
jgi:rfaE bifunctional protein nucleotidyltransferase chain/domain